MDTVILKIYGPNKFNVKNLSLFLPELIGRTYSQLSPTEKSSTRPYLRRYILRPPWQDRYLPKVEVFETLTKDRQNIRYILKIEFSVPKLLYWNSLQEVGDGDMQNVLTALKSALQSVGILISSDTLTNATVAAVHACKNIPLPNTIRMREIINELAKVDISKVFDVSDKQHKIGSKVLNIHSGTTDWSFYDKVADSMRPKNKRSDKARIDHERAVIELYDLQRREVFRYEYRIKKTQTVKREINALLKREPLTPVIFKDLFTPDLMKTLVLKSWHAIIERPENQLALFGSTDNFALFLHILSEASNQSKTAHSMNNAFVSYALATAIGFYGAKEVRGVVFDRWNTDHPERLTKKIELASVLTAGLPRSNNIAFIDSALERYELITLTSLQNGI